MIHRKILKATGCTTERLREIFTADYATEDGKIRRKLEDDIESRLAQGVARNADNAKLWQAVDLAWDSTPIQEETLPLLLWAQGRINLTDFTEQLSKLSCAKDFICEEKNDRGETIKALNLPKLYEVSINLIRSVITRRLAAQAARFSNLWPYFKYAPRGTDMVSKLRGDALSERMDVMVDTYNYRHFCPQSYRHQLLYSRSVIFPRCAWDIKHGWRAKSLNTPSDKLEFESYIEREGIDFINPHPSRVFYDQSAPLPNVNAGIGPNYIGYWDIIRYGDLCEADYWNLDHVYYSEEALGRILTANKAFLSQYYDSTLLNWPNAAAGALDPSLSNDRKRNIGRYSATDKDKGVFVTQYFVQVNPKKLGISKDTDEANALNADVWMRLTVAGDNTVIGGEFLTTTGAACYGGLNENDDREVNMSLALELMPFQDQLTNLFSQMLMNIRASLVQIWCIDQDALDSDMKDHIERTMKVKDYYVQPRAFFYSGSKLRELGVQNPAAMLNIVQAEAKMSIDASMKAIRECLDMADRMVMLSPNERGQPNPREVAAREITEISTTTNAIGAFISDGIDEQRAAMKKMCYEALVCESEQSFRVPVINRYSLGTIKKAGFEVKGDNWQDTDILPMLTPIYGKTSNLIYDYYYDSRDGAERALNSQGAQILSQLLGQFSQSEPIMRAMGRRRLFEMVNEIVRLSGAAFDLQLDEGESEDIVTDTDIEEIKQRIVQLEASMQGGPQPSPSLPAGAPPPPPPPQPAEGGEEAPADAIPAALRSHE